MKNSPLGLTDCATRGESDGQRRREPEVRTRQFYVGHEFTLRATLDSTLAFAHRPTFMNSRKRFTIICHSGCPMLRGLAGWLLLLGVLYIPWHDGGVAPLATGILSALVFLAAMLWLLGHATGETRPRIPYTGLGLVGLLLL